MDIIVKNPYRYLGVYSNASTKERVANKTKMNAFLKVGKQVSFPIDFPILSSIDRNVDSVAKAEANLTLPADQIRFAQFWWMNATPIDEVAFNNLSNNNMPMAKSIWEKKEGVSSLQNRFVLSVINKDLKDAIHCAEILYTKYPKEFYSLVLGDGTPPPQLWQTLLTSLLNEGVDASSLIGILTIKECENISLKQPLSL